MSIALKVAILFLALVIALTLSIHLFHNHEPKEDLEDSGEEDE